MSTWVVLLNQELQVLCEMGEVRLTNDRLQSSVTGAVTFDEFFQLMNRAPSIIKLGDSLGYQIAQIETKISPPESDIFWLRIDMVEALFVMQDHDRAFIQDDYNGAEIFPTFSPISFEPMWTRWTAIQHELSRRSCCRLLLTVLGCASFADEFNGYYLEDGAFDARSDSSLLARFMKAIPEVYADVFARAAEDTAAHPVVCSKLWCSFNEKERDSEIAHCFDDVISEARVLTTGSVGFLSLDLCKRINERGASFEKAFDHLLSPISSGLICTYSLKINYGPHPTPAQLVSDLVSIELLSGTPCMAATAFAIARMLDQSFVCKMSIALDQQLGRIFDAQRTAASIGVEPLELQRTQVKDTLTGLSSEQHVADDTVLDCAQGTIPSRDLTRT